MTALKVKHRFRFYPDTSQEKALNRLFGCVRRVYNRALAFRKEAFKKTGIRLSYGASSAALTQRKQADATGWLKEPSCVPLQQALRHLDRAYVNFFKKRAKYPAFKRKHGSKAQRMLSRRVKGSGRRNRQRLKVAQLHARVADTRKDYLDKVTTDLVQRFGVIGIEDLNVRGMVRNRRLARSISDAGLGTFRRMLEYKCEWYGRELRVVSRFEPTSKRCSSCGTINQELTLATGEWSCLCGVRHDRDINAAINILAAGPAVSARGEHVRRPVTFVTGRSARRSVNQPEVDDV